MSGLPSTWISTSLEVVGLIKTGNTPSTKNPEFYDGKIPFVKPSDLDRQAHIKTTEQYLTADGASQARLLRPGAVLVSCIGNLGKTGIAGVSLATNQQINSVEFHESVADDRYGYYVCKTLKPWMEKEASATTISILNKGRFSTAPFPLAPLPEQKRIADKLDTVLARVDACRDRLNRVPLILKRFRLSVLAAATSGQLTADWREQQVGWADAGSPTSRDTDTSWASQAQPNLRTIGRSDEDQLTICGWKLVSLSKVCQSITDGDHQAPPQATSGIPFITISAINDGQLRLEKASRYVPREYFDQLKSTRKPASGDVLFSVTGSICIPALVSDELEFTFQRHIAILRPNLNEITSKYLYFVLGSEHIKKQGLEVATGTAQLTVSLNGLRGFQIQQPPISEQHEIVRRVETLFAFADRLEARLATARAATERLTPALLAKAFRGELVPQDPADEPAAALLQRLAASRAEAGAKPRRAQKSRSEQAE